MAETAIYCAHVLLEDGWAQDRLIHCDEHGMIRSISEGRRDQAREVLQGPVVPGMPNLHSHAFQRLMTGLTGAKGAGRDSFWTWRQAMYGFANRITPEQLEDCAAWLFAEMLTAGYTSCAEFHYVHHQKNGQPFDQPAEMSARILAASDHGGMPLTLLPVLYQVSGFGAADANPEQARFAHDLDAYLRLVSAASDLAAAASHARVGYAPHSLRAVPASSIRELGSVMNSEDVIHIHIAEQPAEVEDCLAHTGQRPVAWLLDHANLGSHWCLVHATHVEPEEIRGMASTGAIAGLCPTTEADLGDGVFDAVRFTDAGGSFGIGSDSNLVVSPVSELQLLEFTQRLMRRERNCLREGDWPTGRYLWQHAAKAGAQALGQPCGALGPGLRADLVELNPDHPLLAERSGDEVLETWVMSGTAALVRTVFTAGQARVREGRHVDYDALAGRYRDAVHALLQS
ncbi:MAG: formimidoylglutamate deiminase [Xanthomonadales bacterium]|nr:formimidoylglutamate deiminase [Xanthomonadales bacterium]